MIVRPYRDKTMWPQDITGLSYFEGDLDVDLEGYLWVVLPMQAGGFSDRKRLLQGVKPCVQVSLCRF